jgi:hypothetical protein
MTNSITMRQLAAIFRKAGVNRSSGSCRLVRGLVTTWTEGWDCDGLIAWSYVRRGRKLDTFETNTQTLQLSYSCANRRAFGDLSPLAMPDGFERMKAALDAAGVAYSLNTGDRLTVLISRS